MPILRNLLKAQRIYNVPGAGAIHLAPKGKPGSSSQPITIGPLGWGPEVEGALRARPPLVAVGE